jgi:hypothetical protein
MGFELIVSHLKFDICVSTPAFCHTSIDDYDLKVVHQVYKEMVFLCHSLVNLIASITTIN